MGTAAAEGIPALWCDCERCRLARREGERRLRTSTLIDDRLLIDVSPDALTQSCASPAGFARVDDVIVTHPHEDHYAVGEMRWMRPPFSRTRDQRPPLRLHASDEALDLFRKTNGDMPDGLVTGHPVKPFEPFDAGGYAITPVLASHAKNILCMLYIISSGGRTIFYGTDSGLLPQATVDFLKRNPLKFDAALIECTNGVVQSDNMNHLGFNGLEQQKAILGECGCLTDRTKFVSIHFSHNGLPAAREAGDRFAEIGFILGCDGMEFSV